MKPPFYTVTRGNPLHVSRVKPSLTRPAASPSSLTASTITLSSSETLQGKGPIVAE